MESGPAGDEADLLRAHGAGDARAFERLYDRYDRPCFRYIRRMLGASHASAAEDLHQEVWLSVSRHAAAFDPRKATFAPWLFAIARNKVWDYFRKQQRVVAISGLDDLAMTVPDPGSTPLDEVETRELALTVVAAVEMLPLAQRETFVLFADAGLSLEEVADATHVGVETAKSRLRYARAALRQAISDERRAHG